MHPQMAQDTARPGIKSGATGVSCRCDHDMDREGIGKRTIKRGFNFMKRKRISFLAMLILAVILLMPASIQAAAKPGAVKLTKITAVDYNKISIKWKKASGATNYVVCYKEAGNSKWIKLKTLGNTKSSYTHTSSSKYPIVVGQKYQYTVKAYDKNTKKYGSYNTKGLTVTASLKMVTGIQAKIEGTTVKLTWNKVSGADKYAIYSKIKAGDKWSKIITVKDDLLNIMKNTII